MDGRSSVCPHSVRTLQQELDALPPATATLDPCRTQQCLVVGICKAFAACPCPAPYPIRWRVFVRGFNRTDEASNLNKKTTLKTPAQGSACRRL